MTEWTQQQQQQYSLFNEGDVRINPRSYLTYGLQTEINNTNQVWHKVERIQT